MLLSYLPYLTCVYLCALDLPLETVLKRKHFTPAFPYLRERKRERKRERERERARERKRKKRREKKERERKEIEKFALFQASKNLIFPLV